MSLKNNLDSGIRAAVLVVFHDASGALVDMSVVSYDDIIPARMAKRVYGEVARTPSTKQLTTPSSCSNREMYSNKPIGRLEYSNARALYSTPINLPTRPM